MSAPVACMGGWCRIRATCPNYVQADRSGPEPSQRLCLRGHDGVGLMCELSKADEDSIRPTLEQREAGHARSAA